MSLDIGGRAAKLGDRFEGRWIIKNYLDLLEERINSILIEAIGDDERGVDLWVTELSNKRIAYQCKARNGSNNYWTAGDLNVEMYLLTHENN